MLKKRRGKSRGKLSICEGGKWNIQQTSQQEKLVVLKKIHPIKVYSANNIQEWEKSIFILRKWESLQLMIKTGKKLFDKSKKRAKNWHAGRQIHRSTDSIKQ